jgi:hypothetical protein
LAVHVLRTARNSVPTCPRLQPGQLGTGFWSTSNTFTAQIGPKPIRRLFLDRLKGGGCFFATRFGSATRPNLRPKHFKQSRTLVPGYKCSSPPIPNEEAGEGHWSPGSGGKGFVVLVFGSIQKSFGFFFSSGTGRAGNRLFWESERPPLPQTHWKRWGASIPTFSTGFGGRRRRLDRNNPCSKILK